ncbi:MAG: hypothetical protein M1828_001042 [Chrysothrix sp. TS-e1954]|nr:MAG: hypothetical protein M1828_001042 [Chrysothrix sp. TS-e1954]
MDGDLFPDETDRFVGLARVRLTALDFELALQQAHREASEKVTEQLLRIFELEGCRWLDHCNYLSASVDSESLTQALVAAGIDRNALPEQGDRSIPWLDLTRVDCLHGLHRVLAASKFLVEEVDRWWTVRLYEALPLENFARIVQQFPNARPFSDGDIFRNIRLCAHSGDIIQEDMWRARLSVDKARDLNRLLRISHLVLAFDRLLPFRGLWRSIGLGSLHRLLRLKCDEERGITETWSTILGDDVDGNKLDGVTVYHLQSLAPARCLRDLGAMTGMMVSMRFFPLVLEAERRESLKQRLAQTSCLIPSLDTLMKNLGWLEPCSAVLRNIVRVPPGKSLRKAMIKSYIRPSEPLICWGEGDARPREPTENAEDAKFDYVQLWLFAMRNFPHMTEFSTREASGAHKPRTKLNARLQQELGSMAFRLGFRTGQASALKGRDPERCLAVQFVEDIGLRTGHEGAIYVDEVTAMLKRAPQASASGAQSSIRHVGSVDDPARRVGRPHDDIFQATRGRLFIGRLFSIDADGDVGPVFLCKDFVRSFLELSEDHIQHAISFSQDVAMTIIPSEPMAEVTSEASTQQITSQQASIQQLELEKTNLQAQLQTSQAHLLLAQQASEQHLQENSTLQSQIEELRRQLHAAVEMDREEQQHQLNALIQTNQTLNAQVERLEANALTDAAAAEKALQEQQNINNIAQTDLNNAQSKIGELEEQLREQNSSLETRCQQTERLQSSCTELEKDLLATRQELEDLKRRLRSKDDELARMSKELAGLHQETTDPLQGPTTLSAQMPSLSRKRKNPRELVHRTAIKTSDKAIEFRYTETIETYTTTDQIASKIEHYIEGHYIYFGVHYKPPSETRMAQLVEFWLRNTIMTTLKKEDGIDKAFEAWANKDRANKMQRPQLRAQGRKRQTQHHAVDDDSRMTLPVPGDPVPGEEL